MKSVLDLSEGERNCKTLNFTMIAFGDSSTVYQMLTSVKKHISEWFTGMPIAFYNVRTLDRSEGNPELLKKKTRLSSFRISRDSFVREYAGFWEPHDTARLYDYLFCTTSSLWTAQDMPYYAPVRLSKIIHERFNNREFDKEETFADVTFMVSCEAFSSKETFARVDCKISELLFEGDFSSCIRCFKDINRRMDIAYSDVFQSAYISLNYPSMPIVREHVYNEYQVDLVNRYILGPEWYVYFGKNIGLTHEMTQAIGKLVTVHKLQNGVSYTANTNPILFTGAERQIISKALEDILIPGFGVYSWRGLHCQSWQVAYLPKRIDVYYEPHDRDSPSVVLSHGYAIEQICDRKKLQNKNWLGAFALK